VASPVIPPPPPGFKLETETIPPPPEGFTLEDKIPPPPPGFRLETASPAAAKREVPRATIGPARDRGVLERIGDVFQPITDIYASVTGNVKADPVMAAVAKDAGSPLQKPLLKVSNLMDGRDPRTVGEGALRGGLEALDSLSTPETAAFMAATAGAGATGVAGKAAGRAAGGAFTASMLEGLREQVPAAYDAFQRGDMAEAARLAVQAGVTGVMAGAGVKHLVRGQAPRILDQPLERGQAEAIRANVPETGKALKRAAGNATQDPILQAELDKMVEERKAAALPPAANPKPGQALPPKPQAQRRASVQPEETAFDPDDPAAPGGQQRTLVDPELVRIAKELDLGEYDKLSEVDRRVVRALRDEPKPAAGGTKGATSETIPAERETKAPTLETIPPPGEAAPSPRPAGELVTDQAGLEASGQPAAEGVVGKPAPITERAPTGRAALAGIDWSSPVGETKLVNGVWYEDPTTARIVRAAEKELVTRGRLTQEDIAGLRRSTPEEMQGARHSEWYAKTLQSYLRRTQTSANAPKGLAVEPAAALESGLTPAESPRTLEASEPQATTGGTGREDSSVQRPARASGRVGAEATVLIPGSEAEHPVRYALREFDEVAASHSGITFSPNDRYGLKNERNYNDPANQERILKNSQKFNPRYMITDNPDAVNGPPVVDSAGNTIGGNSRVMTLERVYEAGGDKAYREQLQRDAAHYGLDPAEVAKMKRPILVREIADEHVASLPKGAQTLVRDTNKTGTADLTASERATADAQSLTPEASKYIQDALEAEGADASLRDLLGSDKGLEIVNKLVDYGTFTTQEKSSLLDARTGAVTAAARDRIEKMMLGRMFRDSDQFQRTPPAIREKLMKIVSPLAQTEGKAEWDIKADVQEAMDILEHSRAHGIKDLEMLTAQGDMFGKPGFSPRALDLAQTLQGMSTDQMRKAFKAYAEASEIANDPTPSMFGVPEPGQAFADSFGQEVREAQKRLKSRSERGAFSNKDASGPSPLDDLITVGRAAFRRGVVKISQFRKQMLEDFGRAIERYIIPAWQRLTAEVKDTAARAKAEPERGSIRVKSAPPAPPKSAKNAIDEAIPEGDRVKTSPSYDETKGQILKKLAISDEAKATFAESMGKWEAANPERQKVTFADIEREARALDPSLIAELKVPKAGETLNPAVRFAARETLNGLQDELVAKRKQLSEMPIDTPAAERSRLERQVDGLDADAQRLLDVLIPTRSQDGRNLYYHRMMAEKSFDPTYWLSRARSKAGGVLPDKVRADIEGILAEGREAERAADTPVMPERPRQNRKSRERRTGVETPAAEPRPKTKPEIDADPAVRAARLKLAKKIREVEKSTFLDTVSAIRKAGLLTAKTHLRNLGGNASFQALEEVRRVPSAAADMALSLFSGQRTILGPDFAALREASKAAATKGWREAKETWADGATREQLEQFDTSRELNSGWGPMVRIPFTNESRPLVDAYVNQTFRLLGAEDRLFKAFAFERSIQEQLKVAKKNKQPVESPTATMIAQAMQDAEVATFNNANLAAGAVQGARNNLRQADSSAARAALFAFDTVVPFVKTPTNIIARVIEYAGGGTATAALRSAQAIAKKSLTPEQQRAISISFGRGATGLGLVYMGYQLAQNGVMTGGRSDDAGKRNAEEAAGRPPGSILVNGRWHQVGSFSPAGNLLVVGATLQREAEKPLKDELKRPAALSAVATKTVLDQPLLTGAREVVDALENPTQQGERVVTSAAGSFVPTFLNDIGTLFDDVRRDSRGETFFPEGLQNAVKARLPGLRNTLPPRVDVLGRQAKQERTAAIDPTLSQAERTDAVSRELVATKASISALKKRDGENAFAFRARQVAEGRMVEAAIAGLLADAGYRGEAVDTRRQLITQAIAGLRAQVTRNVLNAPEYQKMKPSEQVKLWQEMAPGN
jgi:hypothetical protein